MAVMHVLDSVLGYWTIEKEILQSESRRRWKYTFVILEQGH